MPAFIEPRNLALEQPLWVLTCQQELTSEIATWLEKTKWQATTELPDIRQWLLSHTQGQVLIDLRNSPHKMLSHIRYIKEHFSHCNMLALIDDDQLHWGPQALANGADCYVTRQAVTSKGLTMMLEGLHAQQRQQPLLVNAIDPSTGLINGALFFDRLNHALQVAVRHQCRTGILLVSIDDYIDLIEEHGDMLCDILLKEVAQRLGLVIRNSDSLARVQDGLFAVLLEDLHDEVMVAHIAQNIQQKFEQTFSAQKKHLSLSVSIGGHLCEPGDVNGAALYQQTHKALERAKASGKQGLWFYVQQMNFKVMARLNMLQGLERALDKNEFYLQYQPNHTGKGFIASGVVPVMSWKHPTAGIVMSDIFMDLLIDSGLILKVGIWMIESACQQLQEWRSEGSWNSRMQLFLPVSEKQLRHPSLVQTLKRQINECALEAEQLIIKISEKTAIRNIAVLNKIACELSDIGFAIELHGSNSGYSSFSYLKELNVDYICLDQEFFQQLHMDYLETSIAKVIVKVAHSLGVEVMGCGADSQFKVERMQALGCDCLQGNYFSAPVYSEQWPEYFRNS